MFTEKMREHKGIVRFTDTESLQRKAAEIRLSTLKSIVKAQRGATGSSMSVVDILVALYYGHLAGGPVMEFDPAKPGCEEQDYVVLSKGSAAPTLYSILADLGFFDKSELDYLAGDGALLSMKQGAKVPGITFSNFLPGHGLSVALGLALSLKMDRKENRVFSILDDAALQSGQVWEAMMAAAHYKLSNLICFVDNNGVQGDSKVNSIMDVGSLQDKFESFGWKVIQVTDGHDFDKLLVAIERAFTVIRRPVCLWCRTVPGKGVDFAEGKSSYQDVPLSEGELSVITPKLEQLICKI